ncbi:hypothetical protein LTR09_008048 [Extremus antarcticus]|uniref:Uncharacterized protein n=1 Tax=Extremus antarcticus TaxID=702011 RepID=A0AAJ0DI80_9PEZI|nr:hypothetical protein LTR09_008048 [Extremus antarcticus]
MPTDDGTKIVFITGATGGIGKATAIVFAKEGGYDLALHYNNADQATRDELESKMRKIARNAFIRIVFVQGDLTDYDRVRELHKLVVDKLGHPDILFNNAGSNAGYNSVQNLAEVPIDAIEKTWRINTGSGILLTQLCLPHMEAQNWGRIIFDSSVAAFTGGVVGPHYASSKSAQHGFIHWLAGNVAKKGITVNGVAPALIGDTNMMGSSEDEELLQKVASRIPVGRLGRPEEVADTVLWMSKTGYVTNKVIAVDGGYYPY